MGLGGRLRSAIFFPIHNYGNFVSADITLYCVPADEGEPFIAMYTCENDLTCKGAPLEKKKQREFKKKKSVETLINYCCDNFSRGVAHDAFSIDSPEIKIRKAFDWNTVDSKGEHIDVIWQASED